VKVLITGGAGFIGQRLARRLIERGEGVRILDLDIAPAKYLAREVREGSVLDREVVAQALEGCQGLYHMAALFQLWQADPRA
jgi:dihydroflavonol-4-reductase